MGLASDQDRAVPNEVVVTSPPQPLPPPVVGAPSTSGGMLPVLPKRKFGLVEAYLLWMPLGFLGAHHFYLGRFRMGFLYLMSLGGFGVGWLIDACRMPFLVATAEQEWSIPEGRRIPKVLDAYICWFPLGLLGAHRYYLHQPGMGILYTLTFGLFGIGWLVDGCLMYKLVKRRRKKLETESPTAVHLRSLCMGYVLQIFPFTGILGFNQLYLGQTWYALYYFFTLGGAGVAWFVDFCRMPILVSRINERLITAAELQTTQTEQKQKQLAYVQSMQRERAYLDQAYLFLFPLGFLGFHHFYLERRSWGVLYFFTFGMFGIGWLVDFVRLPFLVQEYNNDLEARLSVIVNGNGPVIIQPTAPPGLYYSHQRDPFAFAAPHPNSHPASYPQSVLYGPNTGYPGAYPTQYGAVGPTYYGAVAGQPVPQQQFPQYQGAAGGYAGPGGVTGGYAGTGGATGGYAGPGGDTGGYAGPGGATGGYAGPDQGGLHTGPICSVAPEMNTSVPDNPPPYAEKEARE